MPELSGIKATEQIHSCCPDSKILAVSLHTESGYARQMLKNGAMGYITKNSSRTEFLKALVALQNNQKYLCEEIKAKIASEMLESSDESSAINTLTKREIEIMILIKQELTSAEIGTKLGISLRTVEVHRYNILKKLKLKNFVALINYVHTTQLEQEEL
jgi:two-component system invasion response regulator UvrY